MLNPWTVRVLLFLGRRRARRAFRIWSIMLGCDLAARDWGEVSFPHPYGIVINAHSHVGQRCTIYQGVTIGTVDKSPSPPQIGDDVLIGAGAIILGPISVGDGARIGAGAVVTTDVPAGATAHGPTATIRRPIS